MALKLQIKSLEMLVMSLTRCSNNHFYDSDKFEQCPHCDNESRISLVSEIQSAVEQAQVGVANSFSNDLDDVLTVMIGVSNSSSLGINYADIKKVDVDKIPNELQAYYMLLNQFKKLEVDNKRLKEEKEIISKKSEDRKSAVIVTTIAGFVMSIGTGFITTSIIPGISTTIAGLLITGLGLYFSLRDKGDKERLENNQFINENGQLIALSGCCEGKNYILPHNKNIIIGRDATSNIIIDENNLSRKHCSIKFNGITNKFMLIDFSSNGTFFDGNRIPLNVPAELSSGMIIHLGNEQNKFLLLS